VSSYAVTYRLRFIDFLLHEYGTINRSAIMDYFGLSLPQASNDIQAYIRLAPENVEYDRSLKTYRRTACFVRVWP
jgi:hypothetical protein